MTLYRTGTYLWIKFVTEDWTSGRARICIAFVKTFPKGSKFYFPNKKQWRIDTRFAGRDNVDKLFAMQNTEFEPKDDFDTQQWLDDKFGPEKKEVI
jgi:hypothetical protein